MKYTLYSLLITLSINTQAQGLKHKQAAKFNTSVAKDSITINHKEKVYLYEDRSDKIRFMGQLNIVSVELAQGDIFKWGAGLGADVFFKKYLSLHAEYNVNYVDYMYMMANNVNNTNLSENEVNKSKSFEVGGRVFIRDKKTTRKHRIILESRHSHNLTIEYYIKPKLPCRSILAIRGGYWGFNTVVNTDMNSTTLKDNNGNGAVKAKDGTLLGSTYYTNSFTRGGYIGIADLVIFSAVTKNTYKKGGVFLSRAVNELYADVLFASTTFDPIIDSAGSHKIVANDPGSFQTLPIGARVGYKHSKENKGVGCYKIELGYRPGLKGNGLYFNVGFALALIK